MSEPAAPRSGPQRGFDLGVLFVHGIGAQSRGQTLAQFGGALFSWIRDRLVGLDGRWRGSSSRPPDNRLLEWRDGIESWADDGFIADAAPPGPPDHETVEEIATSLGCRTLVARADLARTVINDPTDPEAPAYSELLLRSQTADFEVRTERWLVAESCWADTFAPPGFGDFVKWGVRIIPWTVGSHFGSQVRRVLASRPENSRQDGRLRGAQRWLGWTWRLTLAVIGLIAGLIASPLLLAAFGLLLVVALIPIPQVRSTLLELQLKIASTLGDSYVLLSRPIEAASIVHQVRRDLGWLASRCDAVAIVAHSQGGAVAHQTLRADPPERLRLLFTFGSGLKKLEQLKRLMESGKAYRESACLTLIALPLVAISLWWFVYGIVSGLIFQPDADRLGQIGGVLLFLVIGAMFLSAGLRDHLTPIDLPSFRRWLRRLPELPWAWVDCYSTADPVSSGVALEDEAVRARSIEVCNQASVFDDHTSYWANRDEFIGTLVDRLAHASSRDGTAAAAASELTTTPRVQEFVSSRRRWRVGLLSAIAWSGAFSVATAIGKELEAWRHLALFISGAVFGWLAGLLGKDASSPAQYTVDWVAVGYLALVLASYWVTRALWRAWNEREMRFLVQGAVSGVAPLVIAGLIAQLTIGLGVLLGDFPPWWVLMLLVTAILPPVLAREPQAPSELQGSPPPATEVASHQDEVKRLVAWIYSALPVPLVVGILAAKGFSWLAQRLADRTIAGISLGQVPPVAVGVVAAIVVLVVVVRKAREARAGPRSMKLDDPPS